MNVAEAKSPAQIAGHCIDVGQARACAPLARIVPLSILGGAFIALASQAASMANYAIAAPGLGRLVASMLFPTGLMLVLLCGAELFTGNCLLVLTWLDKKAHWRAMLRNLLTVYLGNLLGATLVAGLIWGSGQLDHAQGALGGYTISVAAAKVNLPSAKAFCSGILCNMLVCLAIWMSFSAREASGRIWAIFFPVCLFVLGGFEHCVANMYFIPAGLLARMNPAYLDQARNAYGVTEAALANLSASGFLLKNLLPVTLGNLVGGMLIGSAYYLAYVRNSQAQ